MRIRPATPDDIPAMMLLVSHSPPPRAGRGRSTSACSDEPGSAPCGVGDRRGSYRFRGFLVAHDVAGGSGKSRTLPSPGRRGGAAWAPGYWENFSKVRGPRGALAVYLEVRESNHAARVLYEKWSFIESGRRVRYYRILRKMRLPASISFA